MRPDKFVPVIEALYHAAGKPPLGKTLPFNSGFCGRCHNETKVAEAVKVLSKRFGSWDDIIPDQRSKRRQLCLMCGWAYRTKKLQYRPTIIRHGQTQLEHPTGTDLRKVLAGAIPLDTAVLFPVSGKKAVAPHARWGYITTDFGPFRWERRHAQAVKRLMALKAFKIPEAALSDPAPPGYVLDRLGTTDWQNVQQMWRDLAPIRQDKAMLPVLVKMTREKM